MALVLSTLSDGVLYLYQVLSKYLIGYHRIDARVNLMLTDRWMDGRTDVRTDERTDNRIPIYA